MPDGAVPTLAPIESQVVALKQRYESLKGSTERANFEDHWQQTAELVQPRKIDFVGMRTAGEKKHTRVYDPTGIYANEMLAAGLHGMATNPSTKWFSLRMLSQRVQTPDGDDGDINEMAQVQKYLSDVEDLMWQRIYSPGTQFTTAMHECYLDLGSFGTSILFVGQRDDGGLLFECRPLAECVIAENADGKVDTVYRKSEYTVRQMMQMARSAGWDVSPETKDKYRDRKFDEKVTVIHAVYPREEREHGKKNKENMPFASCYFELEACHELAMGGFPEFPYLVARWSKYSGEVYGRGPAMSALSDIKMLQAMTLTKIKLVQKAADPPMWLRDDGVVGQTRTIPGGINYWRGNPSDGVMLQPVSLQGVQFVMEDIMQLREQILRAFFADIMRMTDRKDMTATEVVQRTSEQMRLFGPLIGRLESELLGPLVDRIFGILTRMNLLPQPPQEVQGGEFTVEYVSPIATAQKQQAAAGIIQAAQLVMNVYGPEVGVQMLMKEVDPRSLLQWAWDLFNNDPDLLTDEEAQAQADQIQQAQMALGMGQPAMGMLKQGASAIKDVAQANAQDGMDIGALLGQAREAIANDPKAQADLKRMMDGARDQLPAA